MKTASKGVAQHTNGAAEVGSSSLSGLFLPEREPAELAISAALFVLSTAYLLLFRNGAFSPDEGITLQAAERILHGQVMYRDFFYFCTPGSYYFLALLFRIFGDSFFVAESALAVEGGLFAVLTYLIARRVCARWSSLLTACLATFTYVPIYFFVLHNWDSTLWAYLALYCAIWFLQRPHWGWALGLGTFCSFTALFEQSKGAGLMLGLVAGFAILAAYGRVKWQRPHIAAACAGVIWPVTVALAFFGAENALLPMVKDLMFPFHHFYNVGVVPYGYLGWGEIMGMQNLYGKMLLVLLSFPYFLVSALPIFGVAIFGYSAFRTRWLRADRWSYYLLVSACTSGLLLSVLVTRKDAGHFAFVGPIFSLVLCWFIDGSDIRLRTLDFLRPGAIGAVACTFTLLSFIQLLTHNGLARRDTRRGVVRVPAAETALDYFRAHIRPGEDILVYPYYPTLYYFSGASNPTPFDFLHPGLNSPEQFSQVLNIIAKRRPRVVIFEPSFDEIIVKTFPQTPIRVLASRDPMSEFILKEYRPCATVVTSHFRHLVFMVRKDSQCPATAVKSKENKDPEPTARPAAERGP
jgi:hypothetical protein